MSASALLDSSAYHKLITAPQVTKLNSSVFKSLLCLTEPIEVHLADNSLVISHQIVHLPLQFADDAIHTVELGCSCIESCFDSGNAFCTYTKPL